ncbi:hypothetical protein O3P69_010622 [Scylla paramamosain]|uniref:Uncharacterized protein n=1 Tax=Scylla paramamosain TaxID=85552 RepID=A0AAW0TFT4_SCYPA
MLRESSLGLLWYLSKNTSSYNTAARLDIFTSRQRCVIVRKESDMCEGDCGGSVKEVAWENVKEVATEKTSTPRLLTHTYTHAHTLKPTQGSSSMQAIRTSYAAAYTGEIPGPRGTAAPPSGPRNGTALTATQNRLTKEKKPLGDPTCEDRPQATRVSGLTDRVTQGAKSSTSLHLALSALTNAQLAIHAALPTLSLPSLPPRLTQASLHSRTNRIMQDTRKTPIGYPRRSTHPTGPPHPPAGVRILSYLFLIAGLLAMLQD